MFKAIRIRIKKQAINMTSIHEHENNIILHDNASRGQILTRDIWNACNMDAGSLLT